ncbi:hypothetical protein IEN92_08875, partial [Polynucleobacter sp. MWH-Creno-3A4]|uniref:beta strand repeat-containing protein n=1 Tax=Polynucleobacter sp. MWH-Creno-3A4 TaxID=1855886 RepID=UPI001C0CFFA6
MPIANVIYDTTRGTRASNITGGALTFTTSVGSVINYIARSSGSVIDPDAIGTSSASLPGYVLLDNTFGCTGTGCTPVSGFINPTTNNLATLATASNVGIGINNAIYATGNIVINGVSSNSSGVNYSAAIRTTGGAITITGSSTANFGIYASNAAAVMSATNATSGVIALNGHSTAVSGQAINTVASATITGAAGVYLTGLGSSGNITTSALIQNSGATGGVIVDAVGNVSLAGVTNSGADGIRITAGDGIAAGTTTGGNVTAVGTITNTGGVVGISMAAPENAACTTGCTIANAIGITTANADATKNISYGILGGALVKASGYVSGNFINYRQKLTNTLAISVTLNSNYSAAYGTGYNSASANAWLQANSTVSYTGSITASFGVTTTSLTYVKSVLMFSPTVGGTTASNGTNANAAQTNTALTAASISATDGSAVTLVPAGRTFSITPAVLGISVSGVYNGTSSFTNQNATIVTSGLASWDTVTNVTVSAANANTAGAYVTAVAGTATGVNTFSSLNYLINSAYNGTLTSGLPVSASQSAATNRVAITPAPLGVTINAVYTGTTTVTPTAFTVTGLVNSQTISSISAATINAINVAANNSNYVTAITLGGGTASISNYVINPAYNTVSSNTQNTVTLTPKALTVTGITIAAKTYDGTKSATVSGGSLVGVAAGDLANVTLAQTATFVSANAANNVPLVMVDSISGSASGNYTLIQPTGITANIAQKVLTVGGTTVAANKVYDGTTAATITGGTLVGVVTTDLANVNLIQSGSFVQSNVANAISVRMSNTLTGPASANYVLTQPANVTANITPKALTVTGTTVANKVYDGSTAATVTGGTLVGVLSADAANVTLTKAGSFNTANAGTGIAVSITDSISGSASGNYSLTQPAGITANITPAPLGITLAAVYSGSTTVTPTSFTLTGLVNGETISAISSANVANINVAANSSNFVRSIVIGSGTALASNYAFNTAASTTSGTGLNTVTLSTKTLTVTGTLADSKVYDGTTSVNVWGGSLAGVVGGDVVILKQAGTFNSANVASAVTVLVSDSISGASSANYTLVQPTGVTAAITPKTLTVSDGTVAHKTYDGTNNAVLTGGSLIGLVSGDASKVTLVQAGTFSSPNVSNGIIIIVNDSITGVAASNYRLIQPTGITANITPAMLGIQVVGVANGTNNITPISYTINGLIGGQTITGLSSVTVSSSSIGSNGSNFVTGIVISGGTALATNYTFAPAYSATSGIGQNIATLVAASQKVLTVVNTSAVTKVYDGTTAITITGGTLVGLSAGDAANVTLVQSAVLSSANVSSTASVIINNTITGASAANYILVQPSGITAIVTPAPLGITITAEYSGTTYVTPSAFTLTGLVAGQTITGLSSATVNNANVANNGSNYVTSIVSSGGTASLSNYSLNSVYNAAAGNTKNVATITAKALTVGSGSVAADKVYDGTTSATITGGSLVGVIGSDIVNLSQVGTYAQSAVGNAIAVTAADTLSGASASNYSIIQPTGLTASITPKVLTVTGVAVSNKIYDTTTAAVATTGTLVGLVSGDASKVTLTQTANFSSANVGNSIPVTVYESITGTAAANYTITQPSGLSANITPKSLTITGTMVADKVYDGTTAATVTAGTLVGLVATDSTNVTFTKAATFSSANAGNAISIVMNDSISGSAAGNYTLTQPGGITANITPKALTVTGTTVANKVYDGNTTAAISGGSLVGVISGDTVGLTQAGSFSQSNAGTGLAVTIADALTNNAAGNYTLTQPTGFAANITPAPITVSIASQTKEYDGTAAASLVAGTSVNAGSYTISGFISGQGAYINQANAVYNSANVANATTVTASLSPSNYIATGSTNLSNYTLPTFVSATGVITPATLTMTANASAKFVGQSDPGFTYSLSGLKGADTSSVLSNASVTRPAGEVAGASYTLTPSATAANYTIVPVTASFSIMAQGQLLIKVGNSSVSYGTLTSSNIAGSIGVSASYCNIGANCSLPASIITLNVVSGSATNTWVATDSKPGSTQGNYTLTITPPTLTAANSSSGGYLNVGSYTFTPSTTVVTNPGFSTNYATGYPILIVPGTISITPLTLSITAPTQTKVYDATTAISSKTLTPSNVITGDQLLVSASGAYASANAGTGLSYTLNSVVISGSDAANYAFGNTISGTNGVITKANLTITGATVANKTYDGTNAASFSGGTLNGVISTDSANLSVTQAGTFSQINVGNNLVVTAADVLTGSAAVNYTLTQPTGLIANITPKALTVTGTAVTNKIYDGTTTATVTGGSLVGVVGSDTVSLNQAGSFSSSNVGTGLAVTIADTLSNNSLGNYTLTQPTGFTANITPKALTVSGTTVANKAYDGTNTASVSGSSLVGVIGGDVVTINLAGTFSQANAGNGLAVTIANYLTGTAAGNYTLTQPTGLTANITPKALTVSGTTVANKVYDGSNVAIVSGGTLVGVVAGENIGLTQAGTFSSANVGTGLAVTIADSLSNNAAGNYTLTQPTGFTANITPRALTVSGTTVANKVYDGATTATVSGGSLVGVVGSDVVTLSQAGNFSQANVGSSLAITIANTLAGSGSSNYTLTQPTDLTADITPKTLTITGATAANKVYDATTSAILSGALSGVVSGDVSNITLTRAGDFGQANVGNGLAVTAAYTLSGSAAGNYTLTQPTGLVANITSKTVTVTGTTVASKTYDGTNVATISGGVLNGIVSADAASITFTQAATFSQANVGNNLVVTVADVLAGSAASNYTLTQPTGLTASITPKALTVTGTLIANKVYDNTTTASISGGALVGVVGSENITLNQAASFSQSDVGNGLVVTVANTLNNNSQGNYTLIQPTGFTANITPAPITVTIHSQTKVYDATDTAVLTAGTALTSGSYVVGGFVSGQGAYINQVNAIYDSANVANASSVSTTLTSANYVAIGSTKLSNYTLPLTVSGAGAITPATLTMTANAATKFDGQPDPLPFTYTLTGLKGADTSAVLINPIVTRDSGEVAGASYTITPSATAANYIVNPVAAIFTIVQKGQLLISIGNSSVTYGTLTAANIGTSIPVSASYCTIGADCSIPSSIVNLNVVPGNTANTWIATDNRIGADQGQYTLTTSAPVFTTSNSSAGGFLNVGNYTFAPLPTASTTPGYVTNYVTSYPILTVSGTIAITPLALTLNTSSQTKVYDGTNAIVAKALAATNAIANDRLTITGSGAYTSASVGTGLSYALSSIAISGVDSGNYSFSGQVTDTNGVITAKVLTVTGASA